MQNLKHIDAVHINWNNKRSVEYARCRAAINQDAVELFRNNAAGYHNWRGKNKKALVDLMQGKIEHLDGKKFVVFPDQSKARY